MIVVKMQDENEEEELQLYLAIPPCVAVRFSIIQRELESTLVGSFSGFKNTRGLSSLASNFSLVK